MLNEIALLSSTEMSRRMGAGELKAEQILDAVLDQVRTYNSVLTAVVTLNEQGAREQARKADAALANGESLGALHGIPITIKDSFATAGLLTTSGFPKLKGYVPQHDATPGMKAGPSPLGFMAMPGILARSASDLPAAIKSLAGSDPRWADVPPMPLEVGHGDGSDALKGLRVAWTSGFPGLVASSETRAAMQSAAQSLADAGCTVEECMPQAFDFAAAREAWGEITGCLLGSGLGMIPRNLFRLHIFMNGDRSDMKRGVVRGMGLKFSRFSDACRLRDESVAQIEQFLNAWDIWLCPVASGPAFRHQKTGKHIDIDGQRAEYLQATGGHTSLFNFTGNPVLVLPVGFTVAGLPIGAQLAARRWGDDRLLSLAPALEEAIGAYRPPPIVV